MMDNNEAAAMMERLTLQKNEFDALFRLGQRYSALPAVVDDDYPEARHKYESALKTFLAACALNRRTM